MVETMYRPAPVITTATEKVGAKAWNELARPRGPSDVADCAAVLAIGEHSVGSMVIMPLDQAHRFSRPVKRVWARVVAHVVAMQRLRASLTLAAPRARAEGVAVLSPSGKVEHATTAAQSTSARVLLREAAIARERARGRLRRSDPDEAVEMWRALVDGRWSIVDRFDRDGRRFLIAHENEPQALEPRALTPRERQVVTFAAMGHSNKLIAYELGLATGAVGRYLAVAMKKLGLRARVDLARVVHEARSS
jgi:DNA-binding NarL/FixJ family response regulator